jgi:preprotein translocase subunit SecD
VEERREAVQDKISFEAMQAALTLIDPGAVAEEQPDQNALLAQIGPFGELTGPEVAVLPVKLQFSLPTITCSQLNSRPAGSIQDPDQLAVACDEAGVIKYLLDVSKVLGTDVSDAGAVIQAGTNRWEVNLQFTGDGQPKWTDLTREATQNSASTPFEPAALQMDVTVDPEAESWQFDTGQEAQDRADRYQPEQAEGVQPTIQCDQQSAVGEDGNCLVATVLDNEVVSAPQIISVITGDARITGDFDAEESRVLASQLRFGALPVTFTPQESQTISATLGVEYLKAGLLAAAIGFAAVLLYAFFYYRLLGTVIFGSLVISSLLTYAALVVLGRGIGYTLTLAGISGFIVAVGIAADSFVIYFERLKDEIREGRTPRSAVPRAWVRARRTIITANAVTLMAAVVLYLLSAGQVRGFAFALGLATVLDLLVVFTFRHPIMTLLARTRAFLSPAVSGLGRALEADRARAAAAPRPGPAREVGA